MIVNDSSMIDKNGIYHAINKLYINGLHANHDSMIDILKK